jgi:glycosyltransferase involved in cell wall biosynthesis
MKMGNIRLLLFSDAGSIHTQRWAVALSKRGFEVKVVGLNPIEQPERWEQNGIQIADLGVPRSVTTRFGGEVYKLKSYFRTIPRFKRVLQNWQPDILHAHYATSYGLLAALCQYHPFVLSVWGTDIFDFPKRSVLHRLLLQHIMNVSDIIASTSQAMAREAKRYTEKQVYVTPFGVDVEVFTPSSPEEEANNEVLTIGTTKKLRPHYGIATLIEAFTSLSRSYENTRLLMVGGGNQENSVLSKVQQAGLMHRVQFVDAVPHIEVPNYLRQMDVFVIPSLSESFGVAALEASACGVPVVASRVGGLPEVVLDGITGFLIPPGDPSSLTEALSTLIKSPDLREQFGQQGRAFVQEHYSWTESVDLMEQVYDQYR